MNNNNYQQLKQWFDAVDRDRSGRINSNELQAALSTGGYSFSNTTAQKMLATFGRCEVGGSIAFPEFQQLHQFLGNVSQAFRNRDRTGDGVLDGGEVRNALHDSGYQTTEGTFQNLMRRFDRDKRGALKFDDYIDLSIFINDVRNTFAFYDQTHSGQVTFNFDSFLTASVTIQ